MPALAVGAARPRTTGLVLAGGRGSRMGGADKGLVVFDGEPLAGRALQRLRPQVDLLAISANRNLPAYDRFGVPVWTDGVPDLPGPLAGILAGLERCETSFLATVPCDAPRFPLDLVARLADARAAAGTDIAVATTPDRGRPRRQPVFCLIHRDLAPDLARYLASGERRVGGWIERHRAAEAFFDGPDAFVNLNTTEALRRS